MSSPVEQIKSRLGIVDVVENYLKLQRAGANLKACCPFHNEKTPSFFVSPGRESWHCFGCNRGGDIFSFVMEIEGVEFYDALKILAHRAGVELKPVSPRQRSERERLFNLLEEAKKFYESKLKENSGVIPYLKERGLKGETAKAFGIGFAPDGWRNLYDFLKSKAYSDSEIQKSGMAIKSEKGYYDRFRSRIMFPLYNFSGQIAGFSGRIFGKEDDKTGKYINTPQTILYDKSKILYGFDKAKTEIRKKDFCVLVEGQMDVIMSHQAGFINTVAVSGTALTAEHLKIIKRLTNNLVMAFDKDEAGFSASKRGIDLALAEGMEVKAALVPAGKDPADAIKENPKDWQEAIENSSHIIKFYLDSLSDRKEIEKTVLPYAAILPSEIEKAHWVKEVAKKLCVKEESVWEELKKIKIPRESASRADSPAYNAKKTRLQLIKDRLIGLLLLQDSAESRQTAEKYSLDLGKADERLAFEAEMFYDKSKDLKKELEHLFVEYEKEKLRNEREEIAEKIRKAELDNDEKPLKEHMDRFNELSQKLNELK